MSDPRYQRLRQRLEAVEAAGLRRRLRPLSMISPTEAILDGRRLTVLCSNDYLGLAQHPEVQAAFAGAGAGSARLIAGDRPAHHALEERLSELYGRPATLFGSGWHANLAVLTTLLEKGDIAASDALSHASLIDGLRLSRAERRVLPHGSLELPDPCRLLVLEGLYSMDGDVPDLRAARQAADSRSAWLLVDEAHAFGATGPGGRGEAASAGIEPDFLVGTLGKALGGIGAFVVGPPELRELLLSRGRTFVFTTGLPEGAARAGLVALSLADEGRRQRLAGNARLLRQYLGELGIPVSGDRHILPIVLGRRTMAVAEALMDRSFYVPGIRPPTVPPGTERLRLSLSAEHTQEQLERFAETLSLILRTLPADG